MNYTTQHAVWAMVLTVVISNIGVCFPVNDFLTLGAFSYPLTFLVTELTNQLHGPAKARRVVYIGFVLGVFLSLFLAPWRIGIASGAAFLCSQLLDIALFSRIRRRSWWYAPLVASCSASLFDSMIFTFLAFYGENLPYVTWGIGDTGVKWMMDLFFLAPFRFVSLQTACQRAKN